jgi:hypothetical protein
MREEPEATASGKIYRQREGEPKHIEKFTNRMGLPRHLGSDGGASNGTSKADGVRSAERKRHRPLARDIGPTGIRQSGDRAAL